MLTSADRQLLTSGPLGPPQDRGRARLGPPSRVPDPGLAAALLLELARPTVESHLTVAGEYQRLRIFDVAYDRFRLAAKKAPKRAEPHDGMARLWRDWGFLDRALGSSYRAVYLNPESAPAHNTLGTILDALGEYDAARRSYERALMLDPTAAWASNNLCYLELRQGHLAEAQSLCEWSLRVAPALSPARNNLALTHAAAGDVEQARQELMAAGDGADRILQRRGRAVGRRPV